jgi:predicted transcriptional regulator
MTRWKNPSPLRKYDDSIPEVVAWMKEHRLPATSAAKKFNIPLGTLYKKLAEREWE